MPATPSLTDTLARRAVERSVRPKQAELAAEMRRIVETTFDLVERTGELDPSIRQILAAAGLSTQAFYRHFRSKDELMLALLDEGRRRLVTSLERRMARARTPAAKVRAWIDGVLAQAADARVAARTRPFVAGEDRLAESYPEEHRASVDLLVSLLVPPLSELTDRGRPLRPAAAAAVRRDAEAVYRLTFATLHDHLIEGRRPTPATSEHLTRFVLRGIGGAG
jgi:AcrR family transcriptional regulator